MAHRVSCAARSAQARRRKHERRYAERGDSVARAEFLPLLTEARVQEAIRAYVRGKEAYLRVLQMRDRKRFEVFQQGFDAVKPVLLEIAAKGSWPRNASFRTFYTLSTGCGAFDGLWVRLDVPVETPGHETITEGAPILDLSFGYFQAAP